MIPRVSELARRAALLAGALCLSISTPVFADDRQSADRTSSYAEHVFGPPSERPAVDGWNGKMAIVTSVDETEVTAITGSVTVPMGHAFGLQIDGAFADIDLGFGEDISVFSVGGHAFWRDPSRGLLGVYGHITQLDIPGGLNLYTAAVENEIYWDRVSLETIIGFNDADYIEPNFFSRSQLAYYPTDDLRLSIGHSYAHDMHALHVGGEWGIGGGGATKAAVFADTTLVEGGETAAMAGMRFYFGQSDKPLIRRHREDDPANSGVYLLGSVFLFAVGLPAEAVDFFKIVVETRIDDCHLPCRLLIKDIIDELNPNTATP